MSWSCACEHDCRDHDQAAADAHAPADVVDGHDQHAGRGHVCRAMCEWTHGAWRKNRDVKVGPQLTSASIQQRMESRTQYAWIKFSMHGCMDRTQYAWINFTVLEAPFLIP